MKINIFTLVLCLGLSIIASAQCPTAVIMLENQADIDAFPTNYPGCTVLTNDIFIEESSPGAITNLNGLSLINTINGNVTILNNSALTEVDGLSQLTSISGFLRIQWNGTLADLDGLSQLTSIGGDLLLDCPALDNLDGLSQLTSIGGGIKLIGNHALMNIDGLSQLTSIGDYISILNNDLITNIDAFSQITILSGYIEVELNDLLNNLDGFQQITTIGDFVEILYNPLLDQCCALCPILAADAIDPSVIGGTVTFFNNLQGCNSIAEVTACSPCGLSDIETPEDEEFTIDVYPNPVQDILHIEYENTLNEWVSFTIKNHLGQQITERKLFTNQLETIDVSEYSPGIYLLNVQNGEHSANRLFRVTR